MNYQVKLGQAIGCFAVLVIAMLAISYVVASSFNPLSVFRSDAVWAKLVVSVLGVLIVISILNWFIIMMVSRSLRWTIKKTSGRHADDVICLACGLPLMQYSGSHGQPIMCPNPDCQKWWHNGPACYNKGMQEKVILPIPRAKYRCPICRSQSSGYEEDLFGELDK